MQKIRLLVRFILRGSPPPKSRCNRMLDAKMTYKSVYMAALLVLRPELFLVGELWESWFDTVISNCINVNCN